MNPMRGSSEPQNFFFKKKGVPRKKKKINK
jgi:hypothetical protein